MEQPTAPKFTPEEKIKIGRAMHLRSVIDSPGWAYIAEILRAIVRDRLDALDNMNEEDAAKAAVLAIEWKRAKAFAATLLATISDQIKEGTDIAVANMPAEQIEQEVPEAVAFPVVKPQCDIEPQPSEE